MKKTVNVKRLSAADQRDLTNGWLFDPATITGGEFVVYPEDVQRPRTRGDCEEGERPCPFVSCRYHLALDVNEESGAIKHNFPGIEVEDMPHTCALDVADLSKEMSLGELAKAMGLSYDRCHQVVVAAKARAHEIAVEMGAAEGIAVRPTVRRQVMETEEQVAPEETNEN